MTRADVRTFAWMVPLALVLVAGWMFRADSCLGNEIANSWGTRNPPVVEGVAMSPPGPDSDRVVVENPYGLTACDNFSSGLDHVFTIVILFVIVWLVGFLSARNFQQHAGKRAAAIMFVVLCLALVLDLLAHDPGYFRDLAHEVIGTQARILFVIVAAALAGAALAWLAATLTIRWRARG